jgi:hypothetical protein
LNPANRLAHDLREMRWSHAAIELVLVVAGILIALTVDDWLQGRRDAQTERQYLEGLVRDFDRGREILKEFGAYHESQAAHPPHALPPRQYRKHSPAPQRRAAGPHHRSL